MEGKRGSEYLLKSVSNIDFNPVFLKDQFDKKIIRLYDSVAQEIIERAD